FPYNGIFLFIKNIIIILYIADTDHSLTFIFNDFHIESPFCYARYYTHKLAILMVFHKFDLHILYGIPFRIGGQTFHIGGMFTFILIYVRLLGIFPIQIMLQ